MTNREGERVFLDTNIPVYVNIAEAPLHDAALDAIRINEQAGPPLWISRQVLREYLAVLTRPGTFARPIPKQTLVTQVHDANIVATMQAYEIKHLFTHFRPAFDSVGRISPKGVIRHWATTPPNLTLSSPATVPFPSPPDQVRGRIPPFSTRGRGKAKRE